MSRRVFVSGVIGLASAWWPAGDASAQEAHVLANGIRVVLRPMPGFSWIGVESFYGGGFVVEPRAQSAHLLEHAMCRAGAGEAGDAGGAFAPDEFFTWANERGMANAETLPTFTHYDAVVPAGELDRVLAFERARLTGLGLDDAIVEQESPRCADEARFVADAPMGALGKFALMAAVEAWRTGHDEVRLLIEPDSLDLAMLRTLHDRVHRPSNLMLVIAGGFDEGEALARVEASLGAIPARAAHEFPTLGLEREPARRRVRWDVDRSGVLVYWPVGEATERERAALSLLGLMFMQRAVGDDALTHDATFVITTTNSWPPGGLPFFAYATLRDAGAGERVVERLRAILDETIARGAGQAAMMAAAMGAPAPPTIEAATAMGPGLAARLGLPAERGEGIIAGHVALSDGMARLNPLRLDPPLTEAEVRAAASRLLTPERSKVMEIGR